MTHDILQADIELAKGLISSDRPDAEVALALTRRGIEPGAAARLVDDLRRGRAVQPQMAAPEWVAAQRTSRRRSPDAGADRPSPEPSPRRSTSQRRSSQRTKEEPRGKGIIWAAAGVLGCLIIAGTVFYLKHRNEGRSNVEAPGADARTAPPASSSDSKALRGRVAFELQPDGLHLGGTLLTRETAGGDVIRLLGSPTRTNQASGGGRLIYAYDHHGLLVYGERGAGTESIVLDFEGTGGTNGAALPFIGTLKIDNHLIAAETGARELTSIKQLGLKDPGADGGIFGGQYNGLELIFAYLKSPQRLSLVEISLK